MTNQASVNLMTSQGSIRRFSLIQGERLAWESATDGIDPLGSVWNPKRIRKYFARMRATQMLPKKQDKSTGGGQQRD